MHYLLGKRKSATDILFQSKRKKFGEPTANKRKFLSPIQREHCNGQSGEPQCKIQKQLYSCNEYGGVKTQVENLKYFTLFPMLEREEREHVPSERLQGPGEFFQNQFWKEEGLSFSEAFETNEFKCVQKDPWENKNSFQLCKSEVTVENMDLE